MTTTATHVIDAVQQLPPISLDELDAVAALQTRVDRKYVLDQAVVDDLVRALSLIHI